ncbi:MAG: hypothetical protein E6J34_20000 [Chloroflexi bacterium]|nr:MAG: hypothetical protein E6J34_20000 [Chloroflexota bacterium]
MDHSEWYVRARNGECGYKAYLAQDSQFFELLAFATLKEGRFRDESSSEPIGESLSPCNIVESGAMGLPIWMELDCFGKRAVSIAGEPAQRADAMVKAVRICFRDPKARKLLEDPVAIRGFIWAKDPRMLWKVAYWLAADTWPAPDGFGGFGESVSMVYERRLTSSRGSRLRIVRLYDQLVDAEGDSQAIKTLLSSNAAEAFNAQLGDRSLDSPSLGLPGFPLL